MLKQIFVLVFGIFLAGSNGCDYSHPVSDKGEIDPLTSFSPPLVIENCGRQLEFEQTPKRIIATSESTAELLIRLETKANILGVYYDTPTGTLGDYAEELAKIPRLSVDAPPSKETALTLKPDFILVHFPTQDLNPSRGGPSRADYEAIGAKVFYFKSTFEKPADATYEGFLRDVEDLGKIFRVESRAKFLTDEVRRRVAAVEKAVANRRPVKTAVCFSANDQMLGVFGSGALNDLIESAGGKNVYSNHEESLVNASREDFALQPIECLVIVDMTHIPSLRADKAAKWLFSTFPSMPASQNARYVGIDVRKMNLSLDSVEALEEMAKAFHPSAFGAAQ